MDLNITNMADELIARAKDHVPFTVMGYRNSAGRVSDLTVRFCGREGYLLLLEESLKTLRSWKEIPEGAPGNSETGRKALDLIEASLVSRLAPKENDEKAGPAIPGKQRCACLYETEDGFIITHLEVLEEQTHEEGKQQIPRNPESAAKKNLEGMLPAAAFLYRMDLRGGKFDHVNF